MAYSLGAKSRAELEGVHPDLVRVVERAIVLSKQDFAVLNVANDESSSQVLVYLNGAFDQPASYALNAFNPSKIAWP